MGSPVRHRAAVGATRHALLGTFQGTLFKATDPNLRANVGASLDSARTLAYPRVWNTDCCLGQLHVVIPKRHVFCVPTVTRVAANLTHARDFVCPSTCGQPYRQASRHLAEKRGCCKPSTSSVEPG